MKNKSLHEEYRGNEEFEFEFEFEHEV